MYVCIRHGKTACFTTFERPTRKIFRGRSYMCFAISSVGRCRVNAWEWRMVVSGLTPENDPWSFPDTCGALTVIPTTPYRAIWRKKQNIVKLLKHHSKLVCPRTPKNFQKNIVFIFNSTHFSSKAQGNKQQNVHWTKLTYCIPKKPGVDTCFPVAILARGDVRKKAIVQDRKRSTHPIRQTGIWEVNIFAVSCFCFLFVELWRS